LLEKWNLIFLINRSKQVILIEFRLRLRFIYNSWMKLPTTVSAINQSLCRRSKLILCLLTIEPKWLSVAWIVNKCSDSQERGVLVKPVVIIFVLCIKNVLWFEWLKLYLLNSLLQMVNLWVAIILAYRVHIDKSALIFLLLLTKKYFAEIVPICLVIIIKLSLLLIFGCTMSLYV
jgi:hypothetical protein